VVAEAVPTGVVAFPLGKGATGTTGLVTVVGPALVTEMLVAGAAVVAGATEEAVFTALVAGAEETGTALLPPAHWTTLMMTG
jgi:hypothetical protein